MVETGRFHDPSELELQAIEDAVVREVVKAMMAIGYFTEEFWEQERLDWEASQLSGGDGGGEVSTVASGILDKSLPNVATAEPVEGSDLWPTPEQSGQEASPVTGPSPEPADVVIGVTMPGENDDRLGRGEGWHPRPYERGNGSKPDSQHASATSTESTKEKQQTIRLDGTMGAEMTRFKTSKGVETIIFPLSVGDETHIITSTKERAVKIHEKGIMPGDPVHVAGVPFTVTRSVNGELVNQQRIYAWDAQVRKEENDSTGIEESTRSVQR